MRGERPGAELTRRAASPDDTARERAGIRQGSTERGATPRLERHFLKKKKKNFQLRFPGQQQEEKIIKLLSAKTAATSKAALACVSQRVGGTATVCGLAMYFSRAEDLSGFFIFFCPSGGKVGQMK